MKLILVSIFDSLRDVCQYSIWIRSADGIGYSVRYAVHGKVDFRLLFKLQSIYGRIYIQSESGSTWWCDLEHDNLYKEFVGKHKYYEVSTR